MSEYWVSKKKYFCKYCEIYIADDVPSRQQHENGLRHQGNRERFIRNIYKASEKKKKDLEEEKRELARVDQAAQAAFAQDISAGHARPSIASAEASSSAPAARKPAPKPSNPFANYTTAASLGYGDPDAERAAAEAELRRTQGVIGEWQIVNPSLRPPSSSPAPAAPSADSQVPGEASAIPVQIPSKRASELHSDDEFDRHSKLRKRTVAAGLGDIYDPGIIPIKLKKKEEPVTELKTGERDASDVKLEDEQSRLTAPPKWVKVQWKKPGDESADGANAGTCGSRNKLEQQIENGVKKEEEPSLPPPSSVTPADSAEIEGDVQPKTEENLPPKIEEASVGSRSLFKKRKTPASAGAGRSRRQY